MTITNKSSLVLTVLGKEIKPGQTRDFAAKYDTGVIVSSDEGRCKVYTEDGKVKFKYEGNLTARYGMRKDKRGHKSVNVFATV